MHPVALALDVAGRPIVVYAYGALLAVATLVGGAVAVRGAARVGVDAGRALAGLALVALGAGLGGWAFQAVVSLTLGDAPGGRAVIGSLLGGLAALAVAAPVVPFPRFADAAIVGAPVAQAIGRLGCFFGGCCYGRAWHGAFALTGGAGALEVLRVPRHPWPLYEAAADLAIALALALGPAPARPGTRTALYFALYAGARLLLELLRGDPDRGVYLGGLVSASQIACAVTLAVSLGVLFRARSLAADAAPGYSPPSED